jgi:hypothetical protein
MTEHEIATMITEREDVPVYGEDEEIEKLIRGLMQR